MSGTRATQQRELQGSVRQNSWSPELGEWRTNYKELYACHNEKLVLELESKAERAKQALHSSSQAGHKEQDDAQADEDSLSTERPPASSFTAADFAAREEAAGQASSFAHSADVEGSQTGCSTGCLRSPLSRPAGLAARAVADPAPLPRALSRSATRPTRLGTFSWCLPLSFSFLRPNLA